MANHTYDLRRQGLKNLQPLYEASSDRRTRGAMNRGINILATTDPEYLFERFPQIADNVGGKPEDLLKILSKAEAADTTQGSFGPGGKNLTWHHRNMSLGELGIQSRKLNPTAARGFNEQFNDLNVKFGQHPAQMRIQSLPTHVPDGIRGNNWLTSHAAGKSPFRLPNWDLSTTAAQAVADAKPIVADNIYQSNFAESLYPQQESQRRLIDALGYNPLDGQEDLTPQARADIGKKLKAKGFSAFSPQEAQQWIAKNSDMLAKLKPKHLAQLGLALPSVFGVAASATETTLRSDKAAKSGSALDWLQAGLSGTSLIADAVPVAGELISTPADAANIFIDSAREPKVDRQQLLINQVAKANEVKNKPQRLPSDVGVRFVPKRETPRQRAVRIRKANRNAAVSAFESN